MQFITRLMSAVPAVLVALALMAGGCDDNKGTAPSPSTPPAAEQRKATVTPLIKPTEIADWCPEHGVPESVCTRCNSSLVAGFKEKGDWDEEHGLPKSQCFKCDPSLKEKFAAAFKEKHGKEPPAQAADGHDHDHDNDEKGKAETKG